MSKEFLINQIEALYPTDCEYTDTNTVGEMLLLRAMKNTGFNWRDLPENVLLEYAKLCQDEDNTGELTSTLRHAGMI